MLYRTNREKFYSVKFARFQRYNKREDFFMEKNTISINKKMAEKLKNIEVKGDIIVPDSKPDIVNIIGTNANPYIYKEECTEGKYRFDGNVDTHIIYLSENGETKCIQTTLDFMDFIEETTIKAEMSTKYRMEITNVETRILNERKISVTVGLKLCFNFFEGKEIEYLDNLNTLSDVEKLQETVDLNTVVAMNTVKSSLKEDVSVDEMEEIADILKSEISVGNIENKISYNKVLSKADVTIKMLYITESSKIGNCEATIPIMNFIDMEKVTDEDICNIDYKVRNMNFKPNTKEMKSISCQVDFEVSCEVYQKKTIEIVQDMYGIHKNITFNQKSIEVQTSTESCKEMVNVSENILVEDIRSIYDVACRANITNKTPMGNGANYEGELVLDIYFETGNNLGVKNAKIPFMVKLECNTDDLQINFTKKHFKLNNEDVVCDVEMEIQSNSSNYKTINIIDDIQEEECEDESDYAMIVYFVKDGDTIWNIARDFKVTIDSIRQANNMQEDKNIHVGEKLYIMK